MPQTVSDTTAVEVDGSKPGSGSVGGGAVPAYLTNLSVKTTGTCFYSPPAYLLDELPPTTLTGVGGPATPSPLVVGGGGSSALYHPSLVSEGIDPILAHIDQRDSRWCVSAYNRNQTAPSLGRPQRLVGTKSGRDAVYEAVAEGHLPFLSVGTKGKVISQCTPESILASINNIVSKVKSHRSDSTGHPQIGPAGTTVRGGRNDEEEEAFQEELKRLMMSQYFMDVLAWQRLDQIDGALSMSEGIDAEALVAEETAAEVMKTKSPVELGTIGSGSLPSKDPWHTGEADSISFVPATLPAEQSSLKERSQLYSSLSSVLGEAWHQRRDNAQQTDFAVAVHPRTQGAGGGTFRSDGINFTTPYADFSRQDRWVEMRRRLRTGQQQGEEEQRREKGAAPLTLRVTVLRHGEGVVESLLEALRELPLTATSLYPEGERDLRGQPEEAAIRQERMKLVEEAFKSSPARKSVTIDFSDPNLGTVAYFGRSQSGASEGGEDAAGAEAAGSSGSSATTANTAAAGALACLGPAQGKTDTNSFYSIAGTHERRVSHLHFALQLFNNGQTAVGEQPPSPSFYLKSYGHNGCYLLSEGRWILGDTVQLTHLSPSETQTEYQPLYIVLGGNAVVLRIENDYLANQLAAANTKKKLASPALCVKVEDSDSPATARQLAFSLPPLPLAGAEREVKTEVPVDEDPE